MCFLDRLTATALSTGSPDRGVIAIVAKLAGRFEVRRIAVFGLVVKVHDGQDDLKDFQR